MATNTKTTNRSLRKLKTNSVQAIRLPKLTGSRRRNKIKAVLFVLIIAAIGTTMVFLTRALTPTTMACPVDGHPGLSSTGGYGTVRSGHTHAGIDIPQNLGAPIYAAQNGVVHRAEDPNGYGHYIWLVANDNSNTTLYGHLNDFVANDGASVGAGQLIAHAGHTGAASGFNHLHWEVHKGATQIAAYGTPNSLNPEPYYNSCTAGGSSSGGQTPSSGGGSTSGCSNHPTIKQSATGGGECVKHLQSHLNSFGYGLTVDGAWGSGTNNAVRDFQSKHGLSVDGVVGPNTWNALHAASGGSAPAACGRNPAPASGSDRLYADQRLNKGSALRSSDGSHSLHMQGDGNLVLYNQCGKATWATYRSGNFLLMQKDNNLVVYGSSGAVWNAGTTNTGASFLLIQNDGNLVLYTSTGRAVWDTRTSGK